jgi:N4-gp56 family major capsid protein
MNAHNINTTGDLQTVYQGAIRQQILATPGPSIPHTLFAVREMLGDNSGTKLTFTRSRRLALAVTALIEGENSTPIGLGSDDITVDMSELGQFFAVSSKVVKHRPWKITDTHVPLLARNWAETLDKLTQLTLVGSTSRFYADLVASPALVDDIATQADFDAIDSAMAKNFAEPLTQYIGPTDGVGTVAILPGYVVICGPDVRADVEQFTNFKALDKYTSVQNIIPGEFGSYKRFRFVMSQQADAGTVQGAGPAGAGTITMNGGANTKVFKTIIVSQDVYGIVDFGAVETIAKLGYSGAGAQTDALNRASTFGWTHDWGCAILDDSRMMVYFSGATGS